MNTVLPVAQNRRLILLAGSLGRNVSEIRQALEELGTTRHEVRFVAHPDALPHLESTAGVRPSVILLGLEEPHAGQLALLRSLKTDEQLRKLPVVVLGLPDHADWVDESFSWGAAGYLVRPADPRELAALIDTIGDYWSLSELPR